MSLLDKFLKKQMDKFVAKNGDILLSAREKANGGGGIEDVDTIVEDYYCLLKAVYRGDKPHNVIVNNEDYYVLTVDGVIYDFDELVHHNDQRNTGRKMEIEILFSDNILCNEVQKRLNDKIANEW